MYYCDVVCYCYRRLSPPPPPPRFHRCHIVALVAMLPRVCDVTIYKNFSPFNLKVKKKMQNTTNYLLTFVCIYFLDILILFFSFLHFCYLFLCAKLRFVICAHWSLKLFSSVRDALLDVVLRLKFRKNAISAIKTSIEFFP